MAANVLNEFYADSSGTVIVPPGAVCIGIDNYGTGTLAMTLVNGQTKSGYITAETTSALATLKIKNYPAIPGYNYGQLTIVATSSNFRVTAIFS